MGENDVDVNLRFTASDETGRVTDDMIRRAQQGSRALEAAYGTQLRAIEAMAKRAGVSIDEMSQRVAQTAQRGAQGFNTYVTSVNRAVQSTQQFGTTSATVMMQFGQGQAHAFAMAGRAAQQYGTQVQQVMQQSSSALLNYAKSFISVYAAIDTAKRGLTEFANVSFGMTRIAQETGATRKEIEGLGKQFHALSAITGESVQDISKSFQDFRAATGMALGPAGDMFNRVALAAHASGVAMNDMSSAAVAAIQSLKVPMDEVSGVLDTWVKTIPSSMMGAWAELVPRIGATLRQLNVNGTATATSLSAAYVNLAQKLGSKDAANSLQAIFGDMSNINTMLGKLMLPTMEGLRNNSDAAALSVQNLFGKLKDMGLYDDKMSLAQKSVLMDRLGVDQTKLDAIKELSDNFTKVQETAAKLGISVGEVNKRIAELNGTPQEAMNRLNAAWNLMYENIGKVLGGSIPDQLAKALNGVADTLDRIVNGFKWIRENVTKTETPEGQEATTTSQDALKRMQEQQAAGKTGGGALGDWWNKKETPITDFLIGGKGQSWYRPADPKSPEQSAQDKANQAKQDALDKELRDKGLSKRKPGFATGGSFEVPGSGGTDTTPVEFMATKGERVDITPQAEVDRYEGLQQAQDKADQTQREYFARFRDKGRQMQRLAMLDQRIGADGGGLGGGAGGRGGGGGGGDPASGTRTGTGARGGDGSGTGDGKTGTPGVGDTPLNTPVGLDPASATGPAESLEEAYKRGYLVPPGGDGATYGLGDRSNKSIPASIRYNNPGAQWPSAESKRFGMTDQGVIGGGNKIAGFPTPVHGLASNIGLLSRNYVGMTVGAAIHKWSGGGRRSVPGFDSNAILTKEMAQDPKFWMAMHGAESGQRGGLSMKQIGQALDMYKSGSAAAYERANPDFVAANKGTAAAGGPGAPGTTTVAGLKTALEGAPAVSADGGSIITSGSGARHAGLDEKLMYAALKSGLQVQVAHGLEKGHARHTTNAPAYDLDLYDPALKRKLNSKNPEDQKRIAGFIEDSVAAGAGGVGAGKGDSYMGAERFHVGGGTDVAWGAGGAGANAPPWLQQAWARGMARRMKPEQLAVELKKLREQQAQAVAEKTKVAGPAGVASDVETRAAARYKAAVEGQAAPATPAATDDTPLIGGRAAGKGARGRTFSQEARRIRRLPYVAPAGEGRAAGKGIAAKPITVRPVSAPGHEDKAAGKGVAPAPAPAAAEEPEGKAAGGSIDAGTPYMVGEQGPEMITPSSSGSVTSAGNTQAMIEAMRSQLERPIEPVIKPKVQQMGPARHRWTRHASQQYQRQATRDEARTSHTDLGFE